VVVADSFCGRQRSETAADYSKHTFSHMRYLLPTRLARLLDRVLWICEATEACVAVECR
jgi:hypothetical protein